MRRSGRWQQSVDDRILELLAEESWSTPSVMGLEPHIHATRDQIMERCRVLADADLADIEMSEGWMVQLTSEGKRYLDGELDVDLYPAPRPPSTLEELERAKSPAYWAATYYER